MRSAVTAILLLVLSAPFAVAQPIAPSVGDSVVLKATHHLGVPLHKAAQGGGDFERVPDGAVAKVLALEDDGHWLRLKIDTDGREGWIVKKYVGTVQEPGGPVAGDDRAADAWTSEAKCKEAVQAGARMSLNGAAPDVLRLGTWNIRWFSRGCTTNEQCPENATNIGWLACVMTWMDIDALAVQEILTTATAKTDLQKLLTQLDQLSGGSWKSDLQSCGSGDHQHVGFLWNSKTITASNGRDIAELNAAATGATNACMNKLRPGRYERFKSKKPGGADFHAIAVHFDSGTEDHDYQNRRIATERITELVVDNSPTPDIDLIVLGDFNTMGREEPPQITAAQEISIFESEVSPGFERLTGPACSEYFGQHGGLLDHLVVSAGMQEMATVAKLTGYCAQRQCADIPPGPMPAAFEQLSDHCPIVVAITDNDMD